MEHNTDFSTTNTERSGKAAYQRTNADTVQHKETNKKSCKYVIACEMETNNVSIAPCISSWHGKWRGDFVSTAIVLDLMGLCEKVDV